jgi:hypothetical protein
MSQTRDSIYLQLQREEHMKAWEEAKESVAQARGVDPDDLSRPDVVEELLKTHELARLKEDMRIEEARQVVASDHNMKPEDVSLEALLKVTCSAYVGYQMTSDWEPENAESGGFKETVEDTA